MKHKIRSSKTAMKRFKITGTGKIMFLRSGHNHMLSKKNTVTRKKLNKQQEVPKDKLRVVRFLIPNVKINK
ncbi:MAG: 50S ribosomal protein L35 [Caldisericia bacterium]|jgi:large subunit ribosomal protein L35|nr:50S ribosomal protein L35 [Caldisericia bacterium]MDD4614189.1 50S ribosomal protein L35 [Caldisericia bacterium]